MQKNLCFCNEQIVLPTILSTALLATVVVTSLYRYRVQAFIHFNVRPFDVDECKGEEMDFDAFVSCADEDSDIARRIVDWLERRCWDPEDVPNVTENYQLLPDGYKVCYHQRDFIPGELVFSNIRRAIKYSKRFVCLISNHYIHSPYCMTEFEWAWTHNLAINKRRMIVIKMPDLNLEEIAVLPPPQPNFQQQQAANSHEEIANENTMQDAAANLRMFLHTHTYIEYDCQKTSDWWSRLLYAMPTKSLPQQPQQQPQ